jgi:GNAT superfamily N-acetyltransferase
MRMQVTVEPEAPPADIETVRAGLLAFNVDVIGDPDEEPVQVFLRDEAGAVVGGLLGHIRWRWLYVAKLWIAAEHRGGGNGAGLMRAAEEHARRRGCIGAYLDTFEYQREVRLHGVRRAGGISAGVPAVLPLQGPVAGSSHGGAVAATVCSRHSQPDSGCDAQFESS